MANIKKGVSVLTAENPQKGILLANDILGKVIDNKSVLFLSGGSTPKPLYELLAKEKKLHPGAVALADERFGQYLHKDSNERMIKETGLIDYLKSERITFCGILQQDRHSGLARISQSNGDSGVASLPRMTLEQTEKDYNAKIKSLLQNFPKRIAVMGIGEDGHTAGLPAQGQNSELKSQNYVTEVRDFPGEFRKRITLTFKALSKMDLLIILAFGSNKKKVLKMMFEKGSIDEIPARFYTTPEIAYKTLLITDQPVSLLARRGRKV